MSGEMKKALLWAGFFAALALLLLLPFWPRPTRPVAERDAHSLAAEGRAPAALPRPEELGIVLLKEPVAVRPSPRPEPAPALSWLIPPPQ